MSLVPTSFPARAFAAALVVLVAWAAAGLTFLSSAGALAAHLRLAFASLMVCVPLLAVALAAFSCALRNAPPSPHAVAAVSLVAVVHLVAFAALFPGLIMSDALYVYYIGARGHIDDYYGYLWPLALNAARVLWLHPATMTLLQLAYFVGLLLYLAGALRRRGQPAWVALVAVLVLGLAPAAVVSVGFQHRDAFTALLSLHWAVVTWVQAPVLLEGRGRELNRALLVQVLLLVLAALARPELLVAAVVLLLALAAARAKGAVPLSARPVLAAAAAVVLIPLVYTALVTRVIPVEKRAMPYLVTLLAQPVGFILSRPDATVHAGMRESADRIFEVGKLVELHTPRNLVILYTPHLRKDVEPGHYRDFYSHAWRLILNNLPEAVANRVMVYLHGNGYGSLAETHQDHASVREPFLTAGFPPFAQRPESLAPLASALMGTFRGPQRGVIWGTLPFVLVSLVVLLRARAGGAAWLVALAIVLRAGALFAAAPSAQLAYHLSVMYMGIALVLMGLGPAARRFRMTRP